MFEYTTESGSNPLHTSSCAIMHRMYPFSEVTVQAVSGTISSMAHKGQLGGGRSTSESVDPPSSMFLQSMKGKVQNPWQKYFSMAEVLLR
jgi:hypothetical protein